MSVQQSPAAKSNQTKIQWSSIQGLLTRNMHDEAFAQILRRANTNPGLSENEDMLLIRAIGKLGCKYTEILMLNFVCFAAFSINKLSDPVKSELFKRSISLVQNCEFVDNFLPCFIESAESHSN